MLFHIRFASFRESLTQDFNKELTQCQTVIGLYQSRNDGVLGAACNDVKFAAAPRNVEDTLVLELPFAENAEYQFIDEDSKKIVYAKDKKLTLKFEYARQARLLWVKKAVL